MSKSQRKYRRNSLSLDENRVMVAFGVILGKNSVSLFASSLIYEPPDDISLSRGYKQIRGLFAYRGDSGRNQMKPTCRRLGTICKLEGIRQPQVDFIAKVPNVTPAATIAPTSRKHSMPSSGSKHQNIPMNHDALNKEPMRARSFGYDSSPIIDEAATIANGIPKPSKNRAMTNMATRALCKAST
jgi:hypothetical protein